MCLILFEFDPESDFPLVVAANRDELYARPSQPAHFWDDESGVFAGRDLEAGGTWLGVSRCGRFSAVTNFRGPSPAEATLSRGTLVRDYLVSGQSPGEYLGGVARNRDQYAGFNLLVGDASELMCFSNREDQSVKIAPGVHGLSNGSLDEPWPKVTAGREALSLLLREELADDIVRDDTLLALQGVLLDDTPASLSTLPDTGIGEEAEQLLSPRFIVTPGYGTSVTTVLRISKTGELEWLEQWFNADGPLDEVKIHRMQLEQA